MPLARTRLLSVSRYVMYFDGVDDYVVVEPIVVYGWNEITIEELIYPFHPKANPWWSKFSMIGDDWADYPNTLIVTDGRVDYTWLRASWIVRKPDGTKASYYYNIYAHRNTLVHVVRRFTITREFSVWVNAEKKHSATVPADYKTVLGWDPDSATYPHRYRLFVLGANVDLAEWMKVSYAYLRIYTRALTDSEIRWNYKYPWNPVRNGLVLWLHAHPDNIKDVDGDGVLEWIDLSGFGNHGKIYGATLVELVQTPVRTLTPARVLPPAR